VDHRRRPRQSKITRQNGVRLAFDPRSDNGRPGNQRLHGERGASRMGSPLRQWDRTLDETDARVRLGMSNPGTRRSTLGHGQRHTNTH
jgi:hypothetical protein